MEKFYLTTAIVYASGQPHIGNDFEIVLADSIVRFKKLQGFDAYLQTGSDEHGQKIQDKATQAGITPKEYVDKTVGNIKRIYGRLNVKYDRFIRTTDSDHEQIVQKIFTTLYEQGDIYKGKYEGKYCVPCESFFTESQIVDNKCPDCGHELVNASEEAYFFKMSKYQDRLVQHIKDNPSFIQPESRKNEMLNNFLKEPLPDLCVSRSTFNWGIPVPFDPKHVIYVWIDALSNYITGLGYSTESDSLYQKYWPANVHLIGKDILRFHTIYWPITLMALNLPLPKQVFGHPWILFGKDKMSKSKGNIMYTDDLIDSFGVDAVRYYVLHEIPFAQDGAITYELLIERINSDLVNNIGNLVKRTVSMSMKYFQGYVKNTKVNEDVDFDLAKTIVEAKINIVKLMDQLRVADAFEEIFKLGRRANKYIDETEPWVLGKSEEKKDRLNTVLYNLIETIRSIAVLLQSYMPETAEKIFAMIKSNNKSLESLDSFGAYDNHEPLTEAKALFDRIDPIVKMKELIKEPVKVETKPEITIDDFAKVDIRVGLIKECEKHPKADKLLVSKIDIGGEVRQIVSGIASWYKPEEMVGKKVLVVVNLKPVELRGVKSDGMILCGENDKKVVVLEATGLNPGDKIR